MMFKKTKKILFLALLFLILGTNVKVLAGFEYSVGGKTYGSSGGCSNCSWVYSDSDTDFGARLSLYTYDGSTLTWKASINLLAGASTYNGKEIYVATQKGRYYYTKENKNVNFSLNKNTSNFFVSFSTFFGKTYNFNPTTSTAYRQLISDLSTYFGDTNADIISNIKNKFNITVSESDLSKYYLVVEPTAIFYNRVKSFYTYGTGYEYTSVKDDLNSSGYTGSYSYNFSSSQGSTIYKYLYNGLYEEKDSTKQYSINGVKDGRYDYYNFINQNSGKGALLITTSSTVGSFSELLSNGYSNIDYPLGINAMWLGYNAVGCSSTCASKTGDSLLKCAENYCSSLSDVTDKTEKEDCIVNQCNYTYTKLSCGTTSKTAGSNTECTASTSSSKENCEIVNNLNYSYKVDCTTNSTVVYPELLPTTILAGQGFEYQVLLYGNKTCTITFDSELWKFNYASSYSDAERNQYLDAITEFDKLSLSNYFYNSSNANISIQIDERIDGTNKTTTKNLVSEENYVSGDKSVVSTSTTKTIKSYHNNTEKSVSVNTYITDSSNASYYKLPSVCISPVDNLTITEGSTCANGLGPYNKYYTDIYTDDTTNDVKVIVEHNSAGLNVNNKCNYVVTDDELACYIDVETSSGQTGEILTNDESVTFTLNAVTDDISKTIRYNIGTSTKKITDSFNNKNVYTVTKNSISSGTTLTIYGTVTDGTNIAYCEKKVIITPSSSTCSWDVTENSSTNKKTLKLKSVNDSGAKYYIRSSTSEKWMNVQQITISNDTTVIVEGKITLSNGETYSCYYNQKTTTGNSCKTLYKPAEYQKIKDYCKVNWQDDVNNYSSFEDCYLSCTGSNSCKAKYDCSDTTSIRRYCQTNYQVDGYNTVNDCINDCGCDANGLKYYYRTISLNDPFPQRDAHYNWLGYEEYITDDYDDSTPSAGGSYPEYEIVLDSKKIEIIKSDTKRYNATNGNDAYGDYVREDEDDTGAYKSKFIHTDDVSDGGFYSYFTYVEGTKTS